MPSLDAQAAALRPLLDMDRSGRGALLMGHSYGGPVIARTAMNYSGLVAGLIFVRDYRRSQIKWAALV